MTIPPIKQLKLYHFPATRSARARWALHETVGDDFEIEPVQLYDGAQYQDKFLRMNLNHSVPVLEICYADGRVQHMIESVAMVALLVDAHPEKKLAPRANTFSHERADYLQMLHFAGTCMDMVLWQIRIHEHVLPSNERDPETVKRYRSKFTAEVEPQLLGRLEQQAFICGEQFCGADIVLGHNVTWARAYGLCAQRAFRDYLSRLSERPAFRKAFDDARSFELDPGESEELREKFSG